MDYRRFVAENATIDTQLGQIETKMRNTGHKFDSFLPKNEDEKKKVDAYNRLKSSRHVLPDLYFQNIGFSWLYFAGDGAIFRVPSEYPAPVSDKSPAWKKEQAQVADIITALVSHYEVPQK